MCAKHVMLIWGLLLAGHGWPAAEAAVLDAFAYGTSAEAAAAWKASAESPAPVATPAGVRFSVPFAQPLDRVFWDKKATLDLSGFSSFELDLTCTRPEALRSLALYFKSGEGWYIWNKPLKKINRQQLLMLKGEFETEGTPAGWHRIEGIRLSPWRGSAIQTELVAHRLTARSDRLFLVRGTTSCPDAGARAVAAKVTERTSHWLQSESIPHAVIEDGDVEKGALDKADVAMLLYSPNLSARELAALKAFLRRGGKLLVFYNTSPELALAMGFKLGAYIKAERPGRWRSFVFDNPSAYHIPERVYQDSPNIFTVAPANAQARVLAWWEDAKGTPSKDPAWLASPQGFWMTHVLMNDDAPGKQALLRGLLGHLMPDIWALAASRALATAGTIDSFQSLEEIHSYLRKQAVTAADPAAIRQSCDETAELFRQMQRAFKEQQYANTCDLGIKLRRQLTAAYAGVQQPVPGEFVGVWDHDGLGWYPGNWEASGKALRAMGVTDIFPNLLWGGLALYPSKQVEQAATVRLVGDQLNACLEAAHRHGLNMHVWIVLWRLDNASPIFIEKMKAAGRLQVNADGKTIPWLCPHHPANRQLVWDCITEMLKAYPVDGIHLDYVRFPDRNTSYSAAARQGFEKYVGKAVASWPRDVRPGGLLHEKFKRWRADQITEFVASTRSLIKGIRPETKLSAAVFGQISDAYSSVGQDWPLWLSKGYVDFVCPMNYTTELNQFITWTRTQLALPGAAGRIFPGLGVTADESQLTADLAIEQVLATRRLGARGFMLFDMSSTLLHDTLPALRSGILRK